MSEITNFGLAQWVASALFGAVYIVLAIVFYRKRDAMDKGLFGSAIEAAEVVVVIAIGVLPILIYMASVLKMDIPDPVWELEGWIITVGIFGESAKKIWGKNGQHNGHAETS